MLEAVPCPECRLPGTVAGSTASSTIYRCPRAHTWKVAKVEASVRMKVGPVEMETRGTKEQVASATDLFKQLLEPVPERNCADGGKCHHRCPDGECWRERNAAPLSPWRDWDEVYGRGQPPDTSKGRGSYKKPKPFGPESLPAKILAYLREPPHRIDHHVAERLWNHSRLAGSIHILRTHGFLFETHLNEGAVAVYELLNPNHQPKC